MIPQEFIWIAKTFIIPPGGLLLIAFIGLLLIQGVKGKLLLALSIISLYLMSTSYVSNLLISPLESIPALTPTQIVGSEAQAILVLCGGRTRNAPEQGGRDTVNAITLERLRYAARIARLTGLPVIPNGGNPRSDGPSESALATEVLQHEFDVRALVLEEESRTTWENARIIGPLLQQRGIQNVFLVTHAWHLPRALEVFSQTQLNIVPAPTAFAGGDTEVDIRDWLPSARALQVSAWAIHEYIGRSWYQLKQTYNL